jgi:hypothetical protein
MEKKEVFKLKVTNEVIDFIKCFNAVYGKYEDETYYGIFNWFLLDEKNNLVEIIEDHKKNKVLSNEIVNDLVFSGIFPIEKYLKNETKNNT